MPRDNRHLITHGHCRNNADTPEYRSWRGMMRRCYTTTDRKYPSYGQRGITVCQRWQSFAAFLEDMGSRPEGCTLDRFPNNDGNYEPSNCRWATPRQQAQNRRNSRFVKIDGTARPLNEVAEERGLNYGVVVSRVKRGWSPEEAIAGCRLILKPVVA